MKRADLRNRLDAAQPGMCACADCGKAIRFNKSGLCSKCYIAHRRVEPRLCSECDAKLRHSNKSGLCRAHYNEAYGKGEEAREALSLKRRRLLRAADPNKVIELVSRETGVHRRDILGSYRYGFCIEARVTVAEILWRKELTSPQIGKVLGRDHSTVLSMLRRFPVYAERKPALLAIVERLAA